MATLTLETPTAYTITYEISRMTEEYVHTATLELYKGQEETPMRYKVHRAIDVAHTISIFGYFGGLEPSTLYRVHSKIFDKDGNQTSDREDEITTPEAYKGTVNTHIHSIEILVLNKYAGKTQKKDQAVYNTFENWGLVAAEQPSVAPPELKSMYVDLPASNGVLDYTQLLLNKVPFGRRKGSWKFYTDEVKMASLGLTWQDLYLKIAEQLNGRECEICLEDDLSYYYRGRLTVNQWRSLAAFSEIVIDYNLESYKYSYTSSDDYDWQFDQAMENPDFNILYGEYAIKDFKVINLINEGDQPVVPEITVTSSGTGEATVQLGLKSLIGEIWTNTPVSQNHPELAQYLIDSAAWPNWNGLWGTDPQRSALLAAAGLDAAVVQSALGAEYYQYYDMSQVTESGIQSTAQNLMKWGYFSGTDEQYKLLEGNNFNENFTLSPGPNIIAVFGDIDIHTKYSEVSL